MTRLDKLNEKLIRLKREEIETKDPDKAIKLSKMRLGVMRQIAKIKKKASS